MKSLLITCKACNYTWTECESEVMLSDITHLPSGWKPRCRPALGRRSSTHQCCHAWSSDPPPAQGRTVGCQWGWEESSMAPGMHLRETEKSRGRIIGCNMHGFFCVFFFNLCAAKDKSSKRQRGCCKIFLSSFLGSYFWNLFFSSSMPLTISFLPLTPHF